MTADDVSLREGSPRDLVTTFTLSDRTMHRLAVDQGYVRDGVRSDAQTAESWGRHRGLIEFLDAQPGRRYLIAENSSGPIGFARVVRFGTMEQLTDLMVAPSHQGAGVGRRLLDAIWPGGPSPSMGRMVIAAGAPRDLSLYMDFGVMPMSGHWHMRQPTPTYLERRSHETDATEAGSVVVLTAARAVAEWKRLEPEAIGHERPALHEFFGRDRACLATVDADGATKALCWVSTHGDIGPAVALAPPEVITVALAALDRVAKTQEPPMLSIYASSTAWHLLHRLRMLGFQVYWPSWIMSSVPLPGLDRYVPATPPVTL